MKEKKFGRVLILSSFTILILLSRVIWLFVEKYFDETNYENRVLAEKPCFTAEGYSEYFDAYTAYFNDNLQFRNCLIQLNSYIDSVFFGKASVSNVILGEDNWLFYWGESDGNPKGCYQGTNILTEDELEELANNLKKQRDYLEENGKEFVIFIAPNKERIYWEYLPKKCGIPADNYMALQIYDYLKKKTDLRVVYPYDQLIEAKESLDEQIYYKTDTHWNYIGGYVGATALLEELGIEMPRLYDKNMTISECGTTSGDLAGMLNLKNQLSFIDVEYMVEGYELHNRKEIEWNFDGMIHYRATDADPRKLYVIRDSFSSHMALYLGSQFNESYLRNRGTYTLEDLEKCNPDIVVLEIVERYADSLASFTVQ